MPFLQPNSDQLNEGLHSRSNSARRMMTTTTNKSDAGSEIRTGSCVTENDRVSGMKGITVLRGRVPNSTRTLTDQFGEEHVESYLWQIGKRASETGSGDSDIFVAQVWIISVSRVSKIAQFGHFCDPSLKIFCLSCVQNRTIWPFLWPKFEEFLSLVCPKAHNLAIFVAQDWRMSKIGHDSEFGHSKILRSDIVTISHELKSCQRQASPKQCRDIHW